VLKSKYFKLTTSAALLFCATQAHALGDQWYLGIGGGAARLLPKPDISSINRDTEQGTVGTLILGRDFDSRSSGQLQLFSQGESELSNGDTAAYASAEAALLYRFYDTRDRQRGNSVFGASFYGRFGLGYLNRDSALSLRNETPVYFGAGAGVEAYFTPNIGLRFEGQYFDTDAAAASISIIGRFGGFRRSPPGLPSSSSVGPAQLPTTAQPPGGANTLPEVAEVPDADTLPEVAELPGRRTT